ncbi:hypothetical protein AZE42_04374 [Rhizopogon vesiculosus]|uniref:Laccase n=1 Tax=Rhizopogon vesiculosus TaxID=180088 RepID=A0A1J8Q420_9AGAM|nr:hypothetical protein AZE42_04374 [Rhizopogon vesiculosus]
MKLLYTILACSFLASCHAASVISKSHSEPLRRSPPSASPSTLPPVTELNIANGVIAPDGFARSATLAGGIFPGPLIKAQKNDHFRIRVVNQLRDKTMPLSTSVHWHGIRQKKTNWADGVAFITQCPIPSNGSFLHRFSAPGQTGTYWYHSHFSTQYCDGLRGPIVIYDPEDPHKDLYDVDDENTVITLSDWYHDPSSKLNQIVGAVTNNSTLINGLGRYPNGPKSPLAVINVEQGLRYRFRVIDPTSTGGPYVMPFNEAKLVPLQSMPVPGVPEIGKADVSINLAAGNVNGFFTMNNVTYQNPPMPVLLQMLSGARHPSDLLPNGTVYELPSNKVIEITIPDTGAAPGGPHPMHLHGHNFAVVRVAGNKTANFVNPIWRDTVSMGSAGDNVTIRFVTDNPGPWFFHCHIDFHLLKGFAVVMAEARNEISQVAASIPPAWGELCSPNDPYTQAHAGAFNTSSPA